MKVIAMMGRDKYLLEADNYELGGIMGEYSSTGRQIDIGTYIPVSELYQATREIINGSAELTNHSEKVAKLMGALAKFGAVVGPIVKRIQEKELKDK